MDVLQFAHCITAQIVPRPVNLLLYSEAITAKLNLVLHDSVHVVMVSHCIGSLRKKEREKDNPPAYIFQSASYSVLSLLLFQLKWSEL